MTEHIKKSEKIISYITLAILIGFLTVTLIFLFFFFIPYRHELERGRFILYLISFPIGIYLFSRMILTSISKIKTLKAYKINWGLREKGLEKIEYNKQDEVINKIIIPYEDIRTIYLDSKEPSISVSLKKGSEVIEKFGGRMGFEIDNIESPNKAERFAKELKEVTKEEG